MSAGFLFIHLHPYQSVFRNKRFIINLLVSKMNDELVRVGEKERPRDKREISYSVNSRSVKVVDGKDGFISCFSVDIFCRMDLHLFPPLRCHFLLNLSFWDFYFFLGKPVLWQRSGVFCLTSVAAFTWENWSHAGSGGWRVWEMDGALDISDISDNESGASGEQN